MSTSTQGNQLTVTTQNGAGGNFSAINWQSFSIPQGSSTYFAQPSSSSTVINRVVTNTPSQVFGTLGSNGHLVLINQSGITVGAGAVVDTAGFTASALKMSDADALAGRMRFGDGSSGGNVSVQGQVLARSGDVVLIGSTVDTGQGALIQAPNGSTILAAGNQVEITGRGLEGISMTVQAPDNNAVNLGTLKGDAVGIFAGTLKHSGAIQATRATLEGGKVVLKASGDAMLEGNASITATGTRGGSVDVLGKRVGLIDNTRIDVSGAQGGGQVRIGGDYQGKNTAVPNAEFAYVGKDVSVLANATGNGNGNGGRVIVWADDTTRAYGTIEAKGGAQGGDGGFIETSGKRSLDVAGIRVRTGSSAGLAGMWLLDPSDMTIQNGTSTVTASSGLFSGGAGSLVTPADIESGLANGDVSLMSSSGISVLDPVTWTSANMLNLLANNGDVTVGAALTATNSSATLKLQAYGGSTLTGNVTNTTSGLIKVARVEVVASGTSGTVNLVGNNEISTIAGQSGVGGFRLENANSGGLTIGSVGNSSAVYGGNAGLVKIKQAAGSLTINYVVYVNGAGSIDLSAAGDIVLGANVKAVAMSSANPTGTVSLTAGGAISRNSMADTTYEVLGSKVVLKAGTGIGSSSSMIRIEKTPVVSAASGGGGVYVQSADSGAPLSSDLVVEGITTNSGDIYLVNYGGLKSTGLVSTGSGSVTLTANSPLEIGSGGLSATGNITLTAANTGNLTLNGPVKSSAGSVTMSATGGTLTQNSSVFGAAGVSASASSMVFGAAATTSGSPISYTAGGTAVSAPLDPIATATSSGTLVTTFEDALTAAVQEQATEVQLASNEEKKDDPLLGGVSTGEICLR
ncbi:filamentous hemagglutinin N-terminal domain-containing protein [Curvibacter sp. APW13]|uniref:two-partner secretion domain-containing protein n=1 Tax=Curvibacter sp. APW13 TaxID=3077236 RepID=UPI0028DDEB7B|nr:filamentous hemagglutinin N-terminal domain-containing protein [Curvibacter sp. APW13]MDT8989512.1 filamentous hemagglutinin N-terminal domain-containing protein [Curvibacter sp. APW13]